MHPRIALATAAAVLCDWNDVRFFLAAARSRSFVEAAQILGTTQPTVSRRIAVMEDRVGTPLFRRTRRGAELTDAGRSILEVAERMEAAAIDFDRQVAGLDGALEGIVTVAAGEGVITYLLLDEIAELQRLHVGVSVRLVSTADSESMLPYADISIVAKAPGERLDDSGAFRVRRVARLTLVPFAASSYLAREERPRSVEDLLRHRLVDHAIYARDRGLAPWNRLVAARGRGTGPVSVVDSTSALHRAIRAGMGIGLLPTYANAIDPALAPVPVGLPPLPIELWLVAHEDSLRARRVRLVYDFIGEVFAKRPSWFRPLRVRTDREAVEES